MSTHSSKDVTHSCIVLVRIIRHLSEKVLPYADHLPDEMQTLSFIYSWYSQEPNKIALPQGIQGVASS